MNKVSFIIGNQRKLFFKDKGMLLFYAGSIVLLGIAFPIIFDSTSTQLMLAAFMTVTLQKQWGAESVAGERENRTLESLLSAAVRTKVILLGKVCFNLFCGMAYHFMMVACIVTTRYFCGYENELTILGWIVYVCAALCLLVFTASYGVLCSAKAANVREASARPTVMCYLFSLFFIVVLSTLINSEGLPIEGVVAILILYFIPICIGIIWAFVRILGISRSKIIEAEKVKKVREKQNSYKLSKNIRSQTASVFAHEMRYLRTLKWLIFGLSYLIICPAIVLCLGYYYLKQNNLYYAILLTIILIPRFPTNLIAYSVGGEKAYKTGESILSTPVSVPALFWGKVAVPMVVCGIMLFISSALNLVVANLIARWTGETGFIFYNPTQLVLLLGVGGGINIIMTLSTFVLSLKAKSPRKGLYFSTILGLVFVLPALGIVYLMDYKLLGAIVYLVVLLVVSFIMYMKISKASRQTLMAALR